MKSAEDFIVPWVKTAEPYSDKHMDVAWEHPQIIRMMSNENLLPPSEPVLDAILAAAQLGNLYPGSGPELRRKLGEAAGLTADHVVLGDGSTDVINFVVHTFVAPRRRGHHPRSDLPDVRRTRAGGRRQRLVSVPMLSNFYWDVDGMLKAVTPATKLIFVCSPNNPTGNQIEEKDLLRILDLGTPTFFDEAYYELENKVASRAPLIAKYPHMVVNRTLSKAFGLAGLRLGYLLCDPSLATYFNRVRIPWNVGVITLAAALAGLDDVDDQRRKRENILRGPRLYPR